jgi:molecular chaperone DnaK
MDKFIVGIDLGTTFSAIATVNEDLQPEIIRNADDQLFTPSAVLIDGDEIVVGEIAVNQWITNEEHVVRWIKRSIGSDDYRFQGMSPIEISAQILMVLKNDAERINGRPIDEAVITCPAYFNTTEIENTKLAGEMAGLNVREIVKEPTAAAIYYGIDNMKEGEVVMVCDLGGGTYDATVLKLENGVFQPITTKGNRTLGGHDWTSELRRVVCEQFMDEDKDNDDPRNDLLVNQILYEECEKAKRAFSTIPKTIITFNFQGKSHQVEFSRNDFENATEWLIDKMVNCTEETLEKAGLAWSNLDNILLVGGSSRLRKMSEALRDVSGITPVRGDKPDYMVALGAAIMARGKVRPHGGLVEDSGGLTLDDEGGLVIDYARTTSRAMGTRVLCFENNEYSIVNALIIPHSADVPAEGLSRSREDLEMAVDNQQCFDVPVVEFESDYESDVKGNFCFVCPSGVKKGDLITIIFHYDVNCIVSVEAIYQKTGEKLPFEIKEYEDPDIDKIRISMKINPTYVVFALDISYSMESYNLIDIAKQALIEQVDNLISTHGDAIQIGIVTFGSYAEVVSTLTSDKTKLKNDISGISISGCTAMAEGMEEACKLLKSVTEDAKKYIVLLTDGMPDEEDRCLAMTNKIKADGIELAAVSLDSDGVDDVYLKKLTPLNFTIDICEGSKSITDGIDSILAISAPDSGQTAQGMVNSLGGLYEGNNDE